MQSICTAVLTISGVRLAIGLTAFALAGSAYAPLRWFHQDAIRIPMLVLAALGAIVDLLVLASDSAFASHNPLLNGVGARKPKRSCAPSGFKVAIALVTLLLVGLETWTHAVMVRRAHAHAVDRTQSIDPGMKLDQELTRLRS